MHFEAYNKRRYSLPWVCGMTQKGDHDFKNRVGTYTGEQDGDEGDLVVYEPCEGQVYGYGQKDHRGNKTVVKYALWDGEKFVPCDMLGRVK